MSVGEFITHGSPLRELAGNVMSAGVHFKRPLDVSEEVEAVEKRIETLV